MSITKLNELNLKKHRVSSRLIIKSITLKVTGAKESREKIKFYSFFIPRNTKVKYVFF